LKNLHRYHGLDNDHDCDLDDHAPGCDLDSDHNSDHDHDHDHDRDHDRDIDHEFAADVL